MKLVKKGKLHFFVKMFCGTVGNWQSEVAVIKTISSSIWIKVSHKLCYCNFKPQIVAAGIFKNILFFNIECQSACECKGIKKNDIFSFFLSLPLPTFFKKEWQFIQILCILLRLYLSVCRTCTTGCRISQLGQLVSHFITLVNLFIMYLYVIFGFLKIVNRAKPH